MFMSWLKRFLCRHEYVYHEEIEGVQQCIWKCEKCGQRYLLNYGLHIGYELKDGENPRGANLSKKKVYDHL
jgi:hypothetical protein